MTGRFNPSMIRRAIAFVVVTIVFVALAWLGDEARAAEVGSVWVDALPRWTSAILSLGALGVLFLTLYLSTRFASKADVTEVRTKIEELGRNAETMNRRMERLEVEVDAMPTKDDLHQISREVAAIGATLKPMASRVERIDAYLLESKDRGRA